jgi:hypothetical protein
MKKPFDLWFWVLAWVFLACWLVFDLMAEKRLRSDGAPMRGESYFWLCCIIIGLAFSSIKLVQHFRATR